MDIVKIILAAAGLILWAAGLRPYLTCRDFDPNNYVPLIIAGTVCFAADIAAQSGWKREEKLEKIKEWEEREAGIIAKGEPLYIKGLALGGGHLAKAGIKQGPLMGETLDRMLEDVLACPEHNTKEYLGRYVGKAVRAQGNDKATCFYRNGEALERTSKENVYRAKTPSEPVLNDGPGFSEMPETEEEHENR